MPPETNLERLRRAFTEVLGEDYDSEIRSLVEGRVWYHAEIGIEEVFNLWVATNVESAADALWIFEPLRVSDRKFLCERFGIQRADIIGKTPKELAEAVLSATGLPILRATGNRIVLANWEHLLALVDNEEDARAAVFARQRAERLLRKILFFYCSTRYGSEFVSMLENPGSLRLHKQLTGELGQTDATRESRVAKLLTVDGWADLGFLALALRKYSERLAEARATHISGAPLVLFTSQEHEAFSKLSTALQPYTHDRPSQVQSMRQELRDALLEIVAVIAHMIRRGVLPDETLVLETGMSIIGPVFKCLLDTSSSRYFRSVILPTVGRTILVLPSADADYANCDWVESPW
jgi:hypothetical protein